MTPVLWLSFVFNFLRVKVSWFLFTEVHMGLVVSHTYLWTVLLYLVSVCSDLIPNFL